MKNAGKACNNRLYRHIRTFEKIVKNYFVIFITFYMLVVKDLLSIDLFYIYSIVMPLFQTPKTYTAKSSVHVHIVLLSAL